MEQKTGSLSLNQFDRWEISFEDDQSIELRSGSVIDAKVDGRWIRTTIEHDMKGYYSTNPAVTLHFGLPARTVEGSR